jgi:hypothetical protein
MSKQNVEWKNIESENIERQNVEKLMSKQKGGVNKSCIVQNVEKEKSRKINIEKGFL